MKLNNPLALLRRRGEHEWVAISAAEEARGIVAEQVVFVRPVTATEWHTVEECLSMQLPRPEPRYLDLLVAAT